MIAPLPTAAQSIRMCEDDDFCEALRSFWVSAGAERAYWRKRLRFAIGVELRRRQEFTAYCASRKELAA
jgi:hypothetical protein